MSAKHAVLGLVIERPGYGYQLAQRLDERFGSSGFAPSGVYSALDQLTRDDLVRSAGEMGGGPRAAVRRRARSTRPRRRASTTSRPGCSTRSSDAAAARRAAHEDRPLSAAQPAAADRHGLRSGTRLPGPAAGPQATGRGGAARLARVVELDARARARRGGRVLERAGSNGCRVPASCSSSCATSPSERARGNPSPRAVPGSGRLRVL